jgi:hypothetical protein
MRSIIFKKVLLIRVREKGNTLLLLAFFVLKMKKDERSTNYLAVK